MFKGIESNAQVYHHMLDGIEGSTNVRSKNGGYWKHYQDLLHQLVLMIKPQRHTNTSSSSWQETLPDWNADETVPNGSDSHDFITDVYCYDLQGATKGWKYGNILGMIHDHQPS